MEEEISLMKNFLSNFNNDQNQSPISEEITRIGNYTLDPEEVIGQVIDWILTFLDNRKCPYSLAVSIAKEIAQQMNASILQFKAEDSEKASDPAALYSEVLGKISTVCNSYLNQANLEPVMCSTKYSTSVFAIKNKRRKMEDRHVIHHDLNALLDLKDAPYQSYYAVFDGHSGIDAAYYASAQLHINIAKHPEFFCNTPKAIIEGFQITDLNFLNKCNKLNIKSGCTALCAFIRENTVYLSWLGDSQAVLVKGGMPVTITSPHKPDREDERQRIEKLGGHVSHIGTWRVNGLLAVTRAIGDSEQKPFISSEPELDIINLDGTEDFLILACDGLWDGISPEDATGVLYRYLAESSSDEPLDAVAAKLVHQSKLQGSEDNITAIVVFLRNINDIKESAAKFLSNPLHCIQSHDFMVMNGNMKMFNMEDPNSETPFSKPTVLELNAASSKKLKNAANVMSSAGFGSASYSYQFVENSAEASFQTMNSSVVDGSHTAFMSRTTHTTSCFAPEATALSELPTPPIDDMLASQKFENFTSTDLYKELSNSVETFKEPQVAGSLSLGSNEPLSPKVDCDTNAGVDNMSLLDTETNSNIIPSSELSADEAVGIASTVVSTTIETAVKRLEDETQEPITVQSPKKLNPYAKPFVMKSFFNAEASESMSSSFIGNSLEDTLLPSDVSDTKLDSSAITETPATEITVENNANEPSSSMENVHQSFTDSLEKPILLDQNASPENVSDKLHVEVDNHSTSEIIFSEQPVTETIAENIVDHSQFSITNSNLFDMPEQADRSHEQMSCQNSDSVLQPVTSFETLLSEQNQKLDNIPIGLISENTTSVINEVGSKYEQVESYSVESFEKSEESETVKKVEESVIIISEIKPQAKEIEQCDTESTFARSEESRESAVNQNSDSLSVSKDLTSEILEAEIKSKCEEIQKNIIDAVEKNENSEILEAEMKSKCEEIQKSIIDAVEKNGNSEIGDLINITDELVPAKVPSDQSTEDSRVESVAVDLKSLPEGIPEAEGVTEDADSDSEKDGGWSYMKGNTIVGSKSKPDEKVLKNAKQTNEIKPNTVSKSKREVLKPNLDVKNKLKNVTMDKTKGTLADKSKNVFADKSKNIVADKTKNVGSIDKSKTLASTDKSKKIAAEKKPDIKSRVLKSSTLLSTTKVTVDKTSRIASASNTKRETETTKSTSTMVKPTRPTTLLRTTTPVSKFASTTVTDKSSTSTRLAAKPRTTAPPPENKSGIKNASSALSKGTATAQNKSSVLLARTAASRPATTVPTKVSTIAKSTVQKSAVTESKPKVFSTMTARTKLITNTVKKNDVKEVKDCVNKQISAKKTTTTSRVESGSTLTNRRVLSNNRSTASKVPSASKSDVGKKDVPKVSALKTVTKNAGSKVSQNASKSEKKVIEPVQNKTDETKNNLNIDSDQKNVTEVAQVVEEKFILETSDKEKVKEVGEISHEEQVIVENGSLTNPIFPDEVKKPVAECNPENL